MSRSGYSDDCENIGLWRGTVANAIRGKRGQAFLREMAAALDAMPVKELIAHEIVSDSGCACAIGAVALSRKMDVAGIDESDRHEVAAAFGISPALAAEIVYENDEWSTSETPAQRWTRMREWVEEHLYPRSSEAVASLMRKLDKR